MKWIEIEAEGDVGKTFVAELQRGVLVRVVTTHAGGQSTEALTFVPEERAASFTGPARPSPRQRLEPGQLDPVDRALWDKVKAATPEVTQYTYAEFEVLKAGLSALREG